MIVLILQFHWMNVDASLKPLVIIYPKGIYIYCIAVYYNYKVECFIDISATNKIDNLTCNAMMMFFKK